MTAPRTSRHRDELEDRLPAGGYYFAPDSIEEHRRSGVLRAWLHVAAILVVLALAGFVGGYLNGPQP